MERNCLMSKCYPKIKEYCREKHGLEFQVSAPDFFIILEKYHRSNKNILELRNSL
jgi:hypothetical protein